MTGDAEQAIGFYSGHPISLEIVLTRLAEQRGSLHGVQPQELWAHDQGPFRRAGQRHARQMRRHQSGRASR
jgi:hypothetical protein